MPTNTYVALAKVTASGSSTTQLIMTSIPNTYTDLIIVGNIPTSMVGVNGYLQFSGVTGYTDLIIVGNIPTSMVGVNGYLQFNGDTGSNYSWTRILGDGSSASSSRSTSQTGINYLVNDYTTTICQIQNYSNSTTYKTALVRANNPSDYVTATVGLWRNTAAITSVTIDLDGNTIPSGTTFSLYGIAAASVGAKATGGIISSDSQYYYHTFLSTGTFTPLQSLTCDYLVVAGGGGGGAGNDGGGGGGGAGGYRTSIGGTPLSVTATNYTITVGGGGTGASGSAGTKGTNSVFSTITSTGGGLGGYAGNDAGAGGSGGGAGAGTNNGNTAGTGNQGGYTPVEGYAGGTNFRTTSPSFDGEGGGGGGSAAVGTAGTAGTRGAGGTAATNSITGTSVAYAGGGSGGSWYSGTGGGGTTGGGGVGGAGLVVGGNGTANTGGGGGGGGQDRAGGSGGSGIVIVRYAK